MVSALTETEARLQGLARGADDYLPKPFSPKELIAKVKRALARAEEFKALERRTRELAGEVERSREETRRAQDELRREKLVQEAYSRLSQELSQQHHAEEVAATFLCALMTHLGVQGAAMLLPDERDPLTLAPRLARGLTAERESLLRVPADGELARLLVALGRPVRREELERFPVLRDELQPLVAAGCALLVPLGARGRLLGLAMLVEKADGGVFGGMDLELATSLAMAATLAVEQSGVVRHAEETYLRAVRAYGDALEAKRPGARRRAEQAAGVAEALARELGLAGTSALSLRLAALAGGLHDGQETPAGARGAAPAVDMLREAPELGGEILAVARAFVDLAGKLEATTPARQVVARLAGDRNVLGALEDLLARGELALPGAGV
jgi:HD-GYP domain-containing protein (c-di-GMP phosphodiesterase class II)